MKLVKNKIYVCCKTITYRNMRKKVSQQMSFDIDTKLAFKVLPYINTQLYFKIAMNLKET